MNSMSISCIFDLEIDLSAVIRPPTVVHSILRKRQLYGFDILSSKFIILYEGRQKFKTLKPTGDIYMRFSLKTLNSVYSHLRK